MALTFMAASCAAEKKLAAPTLNRATPDNASRLVLVITITPAPTHSPTVAPSRTPTSIPPSPTPLPWNIVMPRADEAYPVFPWQVVITSTSPLTASLWLEAISPPEQTYNVTFAGKQTAFPGKLTLVSNVRSVLEGKQHILRWSRKVDDLRELRDGQYRLVWESARGKGQVQLTLDGSKAIPARVLDRDGSVGIRFLPTESSPRNGKNVLDKEPVRVLGQLIYTDEQGLVPIYNSYEMPEQWCFFETQDGRRGWVWCKAFVPYEPVDRAPLLALPISDRLYTRGGQ
jgi:hypothetical protein